MGRFPRLAVRLAMPLSKPPSPRLTGELPPNWEASDEEWERALGETEVAEAIRDKDGKIVPVVLPVNEI